MANVLDRIQWGLAAAHGTPVVTDTFLLGEHTRPKTDHKPTEIEDAVPYRSNVTGFRSDTKLVQDTLSFPNSYFELYPILYSMGLVGGITPTETTPAQGDFLWPFTMAEQATNTPDSGTLQVGDELKAYTASYMMINRIKLSGSIAQDGGASPVMLEIDYFADEWDLTTPFAAGLSYPIVERVNAKLARLYVDTSWAGVGGSELPVLRRFEYTILPGLHPNSEGSPDEKFTSHDEGNLATMLQLWLKRGTETDSLYSDFQSDVAANLFKVARLDLPGSVIGTGTNNRITHDIGGEITDFQPLTELDRGTGIDVLTITGKLDPTANKQMEAEVTAAVSAI